MSVWPHDMTRCVLIAAPTQSGNSINDHWSHPIMIVAGPRTGGQVIRFPPRGPTSPRGHFGGVPWRPYGTVAPVLHLVARSSADYPPAPAEPIRGDKTTTPGTL